MSSGSLPLKTYHRAQSLGDGTFGSVVAVYDDDGEEYALKLFLDDDSDDDDSSSEDEGARTMELGVLREISILRLLREENSHPNIVQIHDVKQAAEDFEFEESGAGGAGTEDYMGIAMPFFKYGTLTSAIGSGMIVNKKAKVRIAHEILSGVAFLHENGIIHRDIKGDNIMLAPAPDGDNDSSFSFSPVLIDFSLAKLTNPQIFRASCGEVSNGMSFGEDTEKTHTAEIGTPTYTSPEVVKHEPYGLKSDMWSVGVVLLELLQGRVLPAEKDKEAARLVAQAKDALPNQPFANLIRGLLEVDTNKRLSAREALAAELFHKFGYDGKDSSKTFRVLNIKEALPLEGEECCQMDENSTPASRNSKTPKKFPKKRTVDPKFLRRFQKIEKLCRELSCEHPLTPHAALSYSIQMSQLEDDIDNIKESQALLDCVVLASKFFERELINLSELEGTGSFANWTVEDYRDNESAIWMLMDFCLYPRQLIDWG